MRFKSGIVAAAIGAALFCGILVHAQNGEKPSNNVKNTPTVGKKPTTPVPQPGAAQTKKPDDAGNKKNAPLNPATTKPTPQSADPDSAEALDEKSIRTSAEAFAKFYNEHDAKGLATLFATKAEMIDEDAQVVRGRDAIEQAFASVFEANPESSMQVEIESIRVLTPSLAIEEGVTRSYTSPNDPESVTGYVAIHVKTDGKWQLGCVRDWDSDAPELTPHHHLQELAWLVGEWIEESDTTIVHNVCNWHDNDNFLMQEFQVQVEGEIAMSGTMRIGWDAVRKQFKSWVFDSHGGHAEGLWLSNGDEWIVTSQGATAKGETASAMIVYRLIDEDTVGWRSYDRVINGERQEDIDEIVVKRRPPHPAE
ncbi:SgcJ/EcaC family oxidoreductase [Schlesneria paludicola]|uniref:SgcJ/EcaC family oxidoreductase n=1 Tax=Schlesneria paludicola TaxID=360056 RepID=UPI00029A30D2|nr:SgcJ/EcaC family oxidoreductase [Schlesneria paludicola]